MTILSKPPPGYPSTVAELLGPEESLRRRRLLERLAVHPGWIVVGLACALLVRQAVQSGLNTDVFWQLAAGQWMLAHHAVLRHDVFSYTVRGRPWLTEEWGFEVILAWCVAHLGPVSYWLLSGGACAVALLASALRWRRMGSGGLWTGGLSIVVMFSLLLGVAPRPQDLSYLFFALELLVLTLARGGHRWLLALPPLLLLWANVHGSFLAGLAVLALEVALAVLHRLRTLRYEPGAGTTPPPPPRPGGLRLRNPLPLRQSLAVFGASVAAAALNPHGLSLFSYAYRVSTSSQLGASIEEWLSPDFHDVTVMLAIALPAVLAVIFLASGRVQTELFDLLVWGGLFLATLHAIRFAPYMGLAFGGLAAGWGTSFRDHLTPTLLTWLAAPLLLVAILAGQHPAAGAPQTTGPLAAPTSAVRWLQGRPGRIFSTYVWNDYLISQGRAVFVDGRTDLYFGTGVLGTYAQVSGLQTNPDPVLERWKVRWVLWPAHSPLSVYLSHDPHWQRVRQFGDQVVFERVSQSS